MDASQGGSLLAQSTVVFNHRPKLSARSQRWTKTTMQKRMSGIHTEEIVQIGNRCSEDAGRVRCFGAGQSDRHQPPQPATFSHPNDKRLDDKISCSLILLGSADD